MTKRYELCFFENALKISNILPLPDNVGTIYIRSDISTISENRAYLVDNDFTTRLFVDKSSGDGNKYYIYGRKKKNKAIFHEHCKNTVFNIPDLDLPTYLLDVHTEVGCTVLTDCDTFYHTATERQGIEVVHYEG